jgi:ABC-type transport system involved in multi-copper enzyme maturation permease subunit
MRQMVWIALGLLALVVTLVAVASAHNGWSMDHWRYPRRFGQYYHDLADFYSGVSQPLPAAPATAAVESLAAGSFQAILRASRFVLFSRWVMFSLFLSFLLPLWSLSFATEALGGEREGRSLVWLLTRPLPRPAIYLAKFVGLLPWVLGLNLGGFGLICLAAGEPGWLAFRLFWPGVLASSLAFAALFHLFGAAFRRATVIALVYSFFLETLLGDMPGMMKRISITFYTRCVLFDAAAEYGLTPEKPSVYQPVDGTTAWVALIGATAALLVAGMLFFSRAEYRDET